MNEWIYFPGEDEEPELIDPEPVYDDVAREAMARDEYADQCYQMAKEETL